MKKMLSLAAMFAVLSYASTASAEVKFGGDVSVRVREVSNEKANEAKDNISYAYRTRLNVSGDFEGGYIFRAVISNEAPNVTSTGVVALGGGGGFQTVGYGNTELYTFGATQLYFGRFYGDSGGSHYLVGRLPLNSSNNPVFDLHLYPSNPLDVPTSTFNNDRLFGFNYGTKIGSGDLNAVIGVFDNLSAGNTAGTGDGLLNDGYAVSIAYKIKAGDFTLEPQVLTALTHHDTITQNTFSPTSASYGTPWHQGIAPLTIGANVGALVSDVKLGFSGFYTSGKGTTPTSTNFGAGGGSNVDYSGYLLRFKAEYGQFLAWYDLNKTTDKSAATTDYTNNFVWVQYKIPSGKVTFQPTLRYLTSNKHTALADTKTSRLRSEVVATLTF